MAIFFAANSALQAQLFELSQALAAKDAEIQELYSRINGNTAIFDATAYNLDYSAAGITATGYDLNGKDVWERIIAVDPEVIPLGSEVYIVFYGPYKELTGWFLASDTGRLIKGLKVDIFLGDWDVRTFGLRKVEVLCISTQN